MRFNSISYLLSVSAMVLMGSMAMTAYADVVVTAPEEIVVVALNDQEIRKGLLHSDKNQYKLDAGTHNIAVKYEQIFYHNSGEHDILRSNVVTLNNVVLQDGQRYRLTLINPPKTFEQGEHYAKQPTIGLIDSQGQLIAQQTGASSEPKSWLGSRIFGNDYDLRQTSTPRKTTPASPAVTSMVVPASTVTTQTSAPVATVVTSTNSLTRDQQLIELWKNSTPQERQKFTAWLGNQAAQ